MKLRIRGNSLRFRLTQTEVARVGAGERVQEVVTFAAEAQARLIYAVEPSSMNAIAAFFAGSEVRVLVPRTIAKAWATGNDVSLESRQPTGNGDTLTVLIEKDFACLKPRTGEDDSDAFPNPSAAQ